MIIGEHVIRTSDFTIGKIKEKTATGLITVSFANGEEKQYPYPEAFVGEKTFLQFADRELQEKMNAQVAVKFASPVPCPAPAAFLDAPPPIPKVQPLWVETFKKGTTLTPPELKVGRYYVHMAHTGNHGALGIYEKCCDNFAWKKGLESFFKKRTMLYAKNVTPEGYSLWFLTHHRWIDPQHDGRWYNVVGHDVVYEYWNKGKLSDAEISDFRCDRSKRITFAKNKQGDYVYLGVFAPVYQTEDFVFIKEMGAHAWTKVYKKIAGDYRQ